MSTDTMRSVVQDGFGGPEVLRIQQVPRPVPLPTEVLVRVHAAGINPVDWKTRGGSGMAGLLGEPPFTLGWDVSGVVEEVGFGDYLADPSIAPLGGHPRLMAVGGGYPIIDNGKCVGGIGISGGSYEQDQHAAEEALAALGFEVPAHGPETSIIADSSFSVQSPAKLVNVDFHQVRGLPPDQHVRLLFSIPVVDELDGLKDSGTHQARWRATHTLGLLDNTLVGSTVGILDRRI